MELVTCICISNYGRCFPYSVPASKFLCFSIFCVFFRQICFHLQFRLHFRSPFPSVLSLARYPERCSFLAQPLVLLPYPAIYRKKLKRPFCSGAARSRSVHRLSRLSAERQEFDSGQGQETSLHNLNSLWSVYLPLQRTPGSLLLRVKAAGV
jgi:hypothetical protein